MNDVDFEELDKAVANALAGGKNPTKPDLIVHSPQTQPQSPPAADQPVVQDKTADDHLPAQPTNQQITADEAAPTISARTAPSSPKPEVKSNFTPEEEDLPAKLGDVAPLMPKLPSPTPELSPPPRPKGKFMDIAPPGAGNKALLSSSKTKLAPLGSEDLARSSVPSIADVAPPQKPKVTPITPDLASSPAAPDQSEAPASPFVPDVSVEKRPLGAFGLKPDEKNDKKVAAPEASELPIQPVDEPALGPEMSQEIIALEEDEDGFTERVREAVDTSTPPFTPPTQEEIKNPDLSHESEEEKEPTPEEPGQPAENQSDKAMPLHFDALEQEEPVSQPHDPFAKESSVITPEVRQESLESIEEKEPETKPEERVQQVKEESKAESTAPAPPPILKSLPEKEVPAGGSIVQQHSGETTTPLTKSWPASPQVPLLSAENYHPVTPEHHISWWVWLLVIIGVLAFGAATGAALFMFNPGLF